MISFVKLSVGASIALILAACSSTTDTTDGGTTTPDTGTVADTGTVKDTGTVNNDTGTGSDTGTGDDAGDGAATCSLPAGQPFKNDPTCDTCLNDKCCQPTIDCGTDQACIDAFNCIVGCNNGEQPKDAGTFDAADQSDGGAFDQCTAACLSGASATVQGEVNGFAQCLGVTCQTECGN